MFFMHRVAIRIYNIFTYQKKKKVYCLGVAFYVNLVKEIQLLGNCGVNV